MNTSCTNRRLCRVRLSWRPSLNQMSFLSSFFLTLGEGEVNELHGLGEYCVQTVKWNPLCFLFFILRYCYPVGGQWSHILAYLWSFVCSLFHAVSTKCVFSESMLSFLLILLCVLFVLPPVCAWSVFPGHALALCRGRPNKRRAPTVFSVTYRGLQPIDSWQQGHL